MPNRLTPKDSRFEQSPGIVEMCVDGAPASIDFIVKPPPSESWLVGFLSLLIVDPANNWGYNLFGSRAALTNGIQVIFDIGGQEKIETTIRDNADLDQCFAGSDQSAGVGPGGGIYDTDRYFSGRMEFSLSNVSIQYRIEPSRNIYLNGRSSDKVIIRIRDDLTGFAPAGTIRAAGRFYVRD